MTTAAVVQGKWIVKFFRKTVCGALYNEGESAAFDETTARLLVEGGEIDAGTDFAQRVKPSATVVRKLTAAEVLAEESKSKGTDNMMTIDTKNMNAETVKKLRALVAEQHSAA